MFLKSPTLPALAAALALTACGKKPAAQPDKPQADAAEAAYAAPPAVTAVQREGTGLVVVGAAPAGLQVRLATPGGEAVFAQADAQGRWRIALPAAGAARIFGLSEKADARQVQAQGYVLVGADGRAALLRAGAGALRLDAVKGPALTAVDFDHDGATVVSGLAPADSLVFLRLDGRQVVEGRADHAGRYAIALPQAIPPGAHALEAAGDNFTSRGEVAISAAAPLVDGPMRSQLTRGGLRVDWLTPGGGVQSTVLLD